MALYEVTFKAMIYGIVEIEADDPDEAEALVEMELDHEVTNFNAQGTKELN